MTDTSIDPAWLDPAWAAFGVVETPGSGNTSAILDFYRDAGHPEIRSDSVAWCAAFVGACLERAGHRGTRSLLARSYLQWGQDITEPRYGAIAVLTRTSDPALGHVGFVVGTSDTRVFLLGGNQSDSVSVESFDRRRVLSLRWPAEASRQQQTGSAREQDRAAVPIFDVALAHVLDMEGGYTDDPHDPGGPTNLGITIATYAAWQKTELTADAFGALKAELRALDIDTARKFYRARYWAPSRAAELPEALALMHFDTSVNHGVGGAARMLQYVCDVEVDGEIGPITLAAANTADIAELIPRYAAVREARYRALPHFWRFGRGWLARVAKTRAAAVALIPRSTSKQPKETTPMTNDTSEPKWWGNSVAIWGTLITTLSTVLPVIAPLFGITLTPDAVQKIGEGVLQLIQVAGGLIGTILAIYGRARATQPLMRKPVSIKL